MHCIGISSEDLLASFWRLKYNLESAFKNTFLRDSRLNFIASHLIEFSHISIRSEFVTIDRMVFLSIQYFGRYSIRKSATYKKQYKYTISREENTLNSLVSFTKYTQRVPIVCARFDFRFSNVYTAGAFRFARKFFVSDYWRSDHWKVDTFQNNILWEQKERLQDWSSLASLQKYDPYNKSYNLIWKLAHP